MNDPFSHLQLFCIQNLQASPIPPTSFLPLYFLPFLTARQNGNGSHFIYYDKSLSGKRYLFANVNSFCKWISFVISYFVIIEEIAFYEIIWIIIWITNVKRCKWNPPLKIPVTKRTNYAMEKGKGNCIYWLQSLPTWC